MCMWPATHKWAVYLLAHGSAVLDQLCLQTVTHAQVALSVMSWQP